MTNRFILLTGVLFLLLCVGPATALAQGPRPAEQAAQERVLAFEKTIQPHVIDIEGGIDLPDEQRQAVKAFFAGLDAKETKVAALKMISDRFVSSIPRDMVKGLVEPFLDDPEPQVQAEALVALSRGLIGGQAVLTERVIALSASDSADVRIAALSCMRRTGDPVYATAIQKRMHDPDPAVRKQALSAWHRWLVINRNRFILPLTSDRDAAVAGEAFNHLYSSLELMNAENNMDRIRGYYQTLDPESKQRFRRGLDYAIKKKRIPAFFRDQVMQP